MATNRTMTFGVIVGNRGFFPDHLAKTGREEIIAVLEAAGAKAIVLTPEESKYGAVETYAEAQRCADLFKKHADEIDLDEITPAGEAVLQRQRTHRVTVQALLDALLKRVVRVIVRAVLLARHGCSGRKR